MSDYADDVAAAAAGLSETPVLMGWSMGGLVAIMVAAIGQARACVGLAPSTPAARRDDHMQIRAGVFGPEEYGITSPDPAKQPSMPDLDTQERLIALESASQESRAARDDRKGGDRGRRTPHARSWSLQVVKTGLGHGRRMRG